MSTNFWVGWLVPQTLTLDRALVVMSCALATATRQHQRRYLPRVKRRRPNRVPEGATAAAPCAEIAQRQGEVAVNDVRHRWRHITRSLTE